MDIGRMDLNLLRVFDAVFEEQNLLRAGKRLHLSQSAVSHALARLRETLNDELFVRTARGMEPTARALAMATPLRDSLQCIRDTLGVMPFEPASASRQFVIAANDYVTAVLLSRLSLQLEGIAPAIQLVIRPSTRLDLAEQIDVGRIDLAIGIFAEVPARFQSLPAWKQEEVLVMRKGHPVGRRKLKLADLGSYPLVIVSLGGAEEGAVSGFIVERGLARQSEMFDRHALEDAMKRAGVVPQMRITVPHSMVVPTLLRGSDMLSIVPSSLAHEFARSRDILIKDLPYPTASSTVRVIWHGRNAHDPAHIWLRQQIVLAAGDLATR
ncbi:MAG: transcriptional regulator, LysR family [Polaromonas sp.]|nr:transcriptional regulator, LysR family [Polaromonas sp.]